MANRCRQIDQEASARHIGNLYRMIARIIVGTVLLLALEYQQVDSKPSPRSSQQDGEQESQQQQQQFESQILQVVQRPARPQQEEHLRAIHYHFDQKMDPFMQLHKFNATDESGNTVTCNDGSPIGYYKRLNGHSKSWIIYLQGGGYCGGEEACRHRWRHSSHLMSSNHWPKLKSVDGILSGDAKDNPYLWNANHIYVPYCSSDSWTGLQPGQGGGGGHLSERHKPTSPPPFAFMGARIIEKVLDSLFDDLPRESSLFESKFVLLAGDSAGATGVIMNLDKVNRLVQQRFNSNAAAGDNASCFGETTTGCGRTSSSQAPPVLRGLADSGWFLDNEPYEYASSGSLSQEWPTVAASGDPSDIDCDRQRCTPLQSIRQAMLYWNGQVPAACAGRQMGEPWRCYFAHRAYQSLKTPLFVVQWLYDEAQLMVDNIIRPDTVDQWNYVNKLVSEMRRSLENVTALFAPSCLSHSLIIKQSWNQININGFRLPHILNSWEEEVLSNQPTLETLLRVNEPLELVAAAAAAQQANAASALDNNQVQATNQAALLGTFPVLGGEFRTSIGARPAQGNQQTSGKTNGGPRAKGRKKRRNNAAANNAANRLATMTNRLSRSTSALDDASPVFSNSVPDVLSATQASKQQQEGADKFRLIDTCGWPQCNRDCPYFDQDFSPRTILY